MIKRTFVICCCAVLVATCLPALAEVAVSTDRRGDYVSTRVVATGPAWEPGVWTARDDRRGMSRVQSLLNPAGDANGDLWPIVAESPVAPHFPWVVWSRSTGEGFDLAYSRWTGRGWTSVEWVHPRTTGLDELDANVAFDRTGRPFVAYWVDNGGVGEVWLSFFLANRWSSAFLVSEEGLDARFPQIREIEGARIVIDFETPDGTFSQEVLFKRPISITDDINPQNHLMLSGEPTEYHRVF